MKGSGVDCDQHQHEQHVCGGSICHHFADGKAERLFCHFGSHNNSNAIDAPSKLPVHWEKRYLLPSPHTYVRCFTGPGIAKYRLMQSCGRLVHSYSLLSTNN